MRTHSADLALHLGDAAGVVASALAPETGGEGGEVPKTSARVAASGGALRIVVEADDAASLRAGVNSYLRWVRTSLDVISR